jgi:hypothetical protein
VQSAKRESGVILANCTAGSMNSEKKFERHDLTRVLETCRQIKELFGEEGVQEYVEHLREDMEAKLGKILGEPSGELLQAYRYFGISQDRVPKVRNDDFISLCRAGFKKEDVDYCAERMAKYSMEIAGRNRQPW